MTETIHRCPPAGTLLTPCCGKLVIELPITDRLTLQADRVTCVRPDREPHSS